MPQHKESTDETKQRLLAQSLVPEPDFEQALRKVLTVSKEESDRQLAGYRATSRARRQNKS